MKLSNFKYPYLNVFILIVVCLVISLWDTDYLKFAVMLLIIKALHLLEDVIEHYTRRRR